MTPVVMNTFNFMKKILTLLFTLASISIYAQDSDLLNKGVVKDKKYHQTIPYEFIGKKIITPVSINNKEYKFLFDTGAPLAINNRLYSTLRLDATKEELEIEDSSFNKEISFSITLPTLNLGNIEFLNSPALLIDDKNEIFNCLGIDGIIGSNILRNSVVQIDHINKKLVITDDKKNVIASNTPFQKLDISADQQSSPYINVSFDKANKNITDKVLFDTGADNLYRISIHRYESLKDTSEMIRSIAEGFGTNTYGIFGQSPQNKQYMVCIPNLFINDFEIQNLITKTAKDESLIGTGILQYGKVTLDYKSERFYFESYNDSKKGQSIQKQWEVSPSFRNNKFVIGVIWNKKLESTINIGDEIVKINDINFENLSFCENIINSGRIEFGSTANFLLKDVKTGELKNVQIGSIQE